MPASDKIEIENAVSRGKPIRVDRAKLLAMRDALLTVLPRQPPGMTAAQAKAKVLPLLPAELFPDGEKAGWWQKAAQLDLEAKGTISRENTKPLRFFKSD